MTCLPIFLNCLLSLALWAQAPPAYSEGLLVVYGGNLLIESNALYHGYDLGPYPDRCGLSGISPSSLGKIAWVRLDGSDWVGPCLVVDAVAQVDAYASIYERHEVAEVSRDTAAALGFEYGQWGYVFWGSCPPPADSLHYSAMPYAPELTPYQEPYTGPRSFAPYANQQMPVSCP